MLWETDTDVRSDKQGSVYFCSFNNAVNLNVTFTLADQ